MKKNAAVFIFCLCSLVSYSQLFNNEWIDFTKTYFKFKVGETGLYRITTTELNTIGLANTNSENFQLWRNGKQVPLFTSVSSGPLGTGGYIEFWGEQNDGVPDRALYRQPQFQLSDKLSLQTDTAAFFLTVNAGGGNLRFVTTANNVSGNTVPAEPFFIHTLRRDFKDRINRGFAQPAGSEYLYSSSYDPGEMWSSEEIYPNSPVTVNFSNLMVAGTGPNASFRASVAGTAPNQRLFRFELNATSIKDSSIVAFDAGITINSSVPLSLISSNAAAFKISNLSGNVNDRFVCGFFELNYPRLFNFNNQSNFSFTIPASATNRYLEITNFNIAGIAPVLYDFTNMRRYVVDIATPGILKVVLQPSAQPVNLVLVAQNVSNYKTVSSFQQRNFNNYAASASQGDYLIITHPSLQALFNGNNQVEQYRLYRASIAGGGYNAKVYDIEELTDQFGFGIKKNPFGVKNFLRFARSRFATAPKFVLLIGKGLSYADYRPNESNPNADRLNLIPTWGYPASDILLASENLEPVMATFIGRLSAIYPREVADYLEKVKQYELAQKSPVQTIDQKAWMKNIVHVVGGNDAQLELRLRGYMGNYENVIRDTSYGGIVTNFNKTSTGPVTPITNQLMGQKFQEGISLITYFGHSSASSLDYNLDDPANYNNTGKYPMFLVNGCNAGNLYAFDTSRFITMNTLSEKFVLAKNKGSIGFIASTHFGLENYLDFYTTGFYRSFGRTGYGRAVSFNINEASNYLRSVVGTQNFFGRMHEEQTTLHGDPALIMNSSAKPDFVVEEPQIRISPNIVSVADLKFTVKTYFYNLGKATGDSVSVLIKQRYPDGTEAVLAQRKIRSVRYIDSISLEVPIVAIRDKGENRISVAIDTDNRYDEVNEMNNTATRQFLILEDELKPVYPYAFSIINRNNAKPVASTANPISAPRQYLFEMDTTELFNSPSKISRNVTSAGGIIEFEPGILYRDSTVYFWRVATVPATGPVRWNTSSFVYLAGPNFGFNQSHQHQHFKSVGSRIFLDTATNRWNYGTNLSSLLITNSIFPSSGTEDNHFSISINGTTSIYSACVGSSVIFNVFDPVKIRPYYNQAQPSIVKNGPAGGFMGSGPVCAAGREFNFEFSYKDTTGRRRMRDFLDWVPAGAVVTARLILDQPYNQVPFANVWKDDQTVYGVGNTIYDRFRQAGFSDIDSFTYPRTWAFAYKKNDPLFSPLSKLSDGLGDRIILNVVVASPDTIGYITSPVFGPAKAWKEVKWRGSSLENPSGDAPLVNVIGITNSGQADTLFRLNLNQQDFNISSVNAAQYPFIRLHMRNQDSVHLTPYQLRYWRLFYDPVPEGALATNLNYKAKDTLEVGEQLDFAIAFKNISDAGFTDSLRVNMVITDKNNVSAIVPVARKKNIQPGDTINIAARIDTRQLSGNNTLFLDVNPDFVQPEQFRFNNILYKNFFVKPDTYQPLMDVTFDGVHILNGDIVSAKPKIVVKLKDESKFLALNDTSLATVFLQYPGNNAPLRRIAYDNDTLRFIPADLSTGKNEASIEFTPWLRQDSGNDFYELIVRAKDRSGNAAGNIEYRVRFQVINKPMITNMFNYPNPFTTSTAFVFTLTGSSVPQNIRIQIMTITGKVVKEITKNDLGPINIGRNITDYKWDGTDQYGQKLANGVYLFRVITNQDGASLEKFNTLDANGDKVNTDKYFNKGYGKMYLMR